MTKAKTERSKTQARTAPKVDTAGGGASELGAAAEFSRVVAVERIGKDGLAVTLEASAAERATLATRFGIVSLDRLAGQARLEWIEGGPRVRLCVDWAAEVVQSCVVTLDAVPASLAARFDLVFAPERGLIEEGSIGGGRAFVVDLDESAEDPPEPLRDGRIDVGQSLAEHLALALDPYPRRPGAAVPECYSAGVESAGAEGAVLRTESPGPGPFAALERWRRPG